MEGTGWDANNFNVAIANTDAEVGVVGMLADTSINAHVQRRG